MNLFKSCIKTPLTQPDLQTATPNFRISTCSFLEGKFCPFPEAQFSIATHVLHDDTSVLDEIRGVPSPHNSKQIVLFHLADHCRRLRQSAKYLTIDIAPIDLEAI